MKSVLFKKCLFYIEVFLLEQGQNVHENLEHDTTWIDEQEEVGVSLVLVGAKLLDLPNSIVKY